LWRGFWRAIAAAFGVAAPGSATNLNGER